MEKKNQYVRAIHSAIDAFMPEKHRDIFFLHFDVISYVFFFFLNNTDGQTSADARTRTIARRSWFIGRLCCFTYPIVWSTDRRRSERSQAARISRFSTLSLPPSAPSPLLQIGRWPNDFGAFGARRAWHTPETLAGDRRTAENEKKKKWKRE